MTKSKPNSWILILCERNGEKNRQTDRQRLSVRERETNRARKREDEGETIELSPLSFAI